MASERKNNDFIMPFSNREKGSFYLQFEINSKKIRDNHSTGNIDASFTNINPK